MLKFLSIFLLGFSFVLVSGEEAFARPSVAQITKQYKLSKRQEARYLREFKSFDKRADQAAKHNLNNKTFWYLTSRAEKANKKWQDARKRTERLRLKKFRAVMDAADGRKKKSKDSLIDDLIYRPGGYQPGLNCATCGSSFGQ